MEKVYELFDYSTLNSVAVLRMIWDDELQAPVPKEIHWVDNVTTNGWRYLLIDGQVRERH